jgi:2-polyprenyl-3-methyl-5-hydroxy-6-metoxy-1,4-benzoquinol methylase
VCDVFYEGYSESVRPQLMTGVIRSIERSIIPFESDRFDFVINNQVMEHVEGLDSALSEVDHG